MLRRAAGRLHMILALVALAAAQAFCQELEFMYRLVKSLTGPGVT